MGRPKIIYNPIDTATRYIKRALPSERFQKAYTERNMIDCSVLDGSTPYVSFRYGFYYNLNTNTLKYHVDPKELSVFDSDITKIRKRAYEMHKYEIAMSMVRLARIIDICKTDIDTVNLYLEAIKILWPSDNKSAIEILKRCDSDINIGDIYTDQAVTITSDTPISLHIYDEYYLCANKGEVVKFSAETNEIVLAREIYNLDVVAEFAAGLLFLINDSLGI